jgi:serine protease Do
MPTRRRWLATLMGATCLWAVGAARADEPPAPPAPAEARVLSRAFTAAARAVGPSVVRVEARFEGREDSASVSGMVIDTAGHVVTRAAPLEGASAISVRLSDARCLPARSLGADPWSGVAVLRLVDATSDLDAARFADSDLVEVGDWVLAVGRPAGGDVTVSAGIVGGRSDPPRRSSAAVGAHAPGLIHTDAVVDAETSGGPLVNLDGEVIALATPSLSIPINQVRRVAQMIIQSGQAEYPYMGVALLDVRDLDPAERARLGATPPSHGALVSRIWQGAPAARAGLRPGDVITTIDDHETLAAVDVVGHVSTHAVGERLTVGFIRAGRERRAQVSLDALPAVPSPRDNTNWVISAGAPSLMGGPQ